MNKLLLFFAGVVLLTSARADFDIYFLRHGETSWNRAKILQGSTSYTDLTPRGVRMAERTAEGLKDAGVTFDRIYASPYLRARRTAEIVAGEKSPLLVDARLREMCVGRYEGVRSERGRYPDDNLRCFFEEPERYVPQGEGAESLDDVGRRLRDFLERELVPLDGRVDRVLCVSHSFVLKALLRELFGEDVPAEAKAPLQRNCCMHVLHYAKGRFTLKEACRIFYDPQEFDALPKTRTVAHRGAGDLGMPEASRPAYSNAVSSVCDIVKLDLQETKDGVIVMGHDPTLKRNMGWDVTINDLTYAEILEKGRFKPVGGFGGARIVRVDEALEIVRPVPEFWIDFKRFTPDFAERVLAEFRRARIDTSRLMVATFSKAALKHFQEKHPEIRRVGHISGMTREDILRYRDQFGLFGVNLPVNKGQTSPEDVAFLRQHGLWTSLWFVQNARTAAKYREAGADAFVTDHVTAVREILEGPCPRAALAVAYAGDDPAVKFAAEELRTCLKGAIGTVRFGEDASLGPQEWRIAGKDGTVTLYGRDGQGQVYAAYVFLEKYAGCRWYAPDTSVIPDRTGWKLPDVDDRGKPAMLDREMYVGTDYMDSTWRLRNKETSRVDYNCGFFVGSPRENHTFGPYHQQIKDKLTPEMMGKTAKGKPSGQFCPSHPAVRHLVAERMKDYIRSDRTARAGKPRYTWPTVYELSQDDGGAGRCRCSVCSNLCAAAGGRASAANLAFTGAVAEEVGKEFPDVIVRTFAYSYTEQAPENDFVAPDNLAIRFCRSFLFQPLTEDTDNGRALVEWGRHVKLKQIWSYWRPFSGPLFPAVKPRDDIGNEMRFCRDQGVFGYFAEDEQPLSRSFALMQHWLFLKLSENPDLDVWKLSDEFLSAYYGKAASAVARYLSYLEQREKENYAALDRSFIRNLDSGTLAMYVQRAYLDRAFFETANRHLDEAERLVAGDARSARHVAHERLVVDRALLENASSVGLSGDSPAFAAAVGRIRRTAPDLVANWKFPPKDRAVRLAGAQAEAEIVSHLPAPAPDELKGRSFIEWPCNRLGTDGKKLVQDADSVFGYALTFPKTTHKLPYRAGVYDPIVKKIAERKLEAKDIPADGKFHLYRLGTIDLVCESRVYYEWSWKYTTWVPPFGLQTDKREVWLSVKLTGPTYVKDSTDPDGIFVERMFFVKPQEER